MEEPARRGVFNDAACYIAKALNSTDLTGSPVKSYVEDLILELQGVNFCKTNYSKQNSSLLSFLARANELEFLQEGYPELCAVNFRKVMNITHSNPIH